MSNSPYTAEYQDLTPAQKSVITRRKNKLYRANARLQQARLSKDLDLLVEQVALLEIRRRGLQLSEKVSSAEDSLPAKTLLQEDQIVKGSISIDSLSGVYFLIKQEKVVYVGQSCNIFNRIAGHSSKDFDSFAYIKCEKQHLDKLESMYIHFLHPELNGNMADGTKLAPLTLNFLLK